MFGMDGFHLSDSGSILHGNEGKEDADFFVSEVVRRLVLCCKECAWVCM